jgi:hypothetical protein
MVIQFIKDWALLSFLLLNATWVYFGFIMRLRQVRDEGKLTFKNTPFAFALGYAHLFIGLVLDVLVNWVFCTIAGLEFPKEFLTTSRWIRWFDLPQTTLLNRWRKGVANWFSAHFLDDVDPDGNHIKR